jgi:aspartate aminotransferase
MRPQISARARHLPASPIRKLMPLADDARRRGVRVLHLNIGQPDVETPHALRRRLAAIQDRVFAYTPSAGTPEYLATLREYYRGLGIELGLNEVLATTGGSEAILFTMLACAADGDEALVVEPFYTNYCAFATMAGVRLAPVTTRVEDGFHLPPRADWERALTPRTRLVLLCNPNNPTGTVYEADELGMVADFCREHGLFLVADEVYREFVYDGRTAQSALTLQGCEDLVVVVDSLSKRYSACGIRLGCLVTRNRDVYHAALRMAQARLSPPGLAQAVAVGARDVAPDEMQAIVDEYQRRRDLLYDGLSEIPGVFLRKPEGAFYFVVRLPVVDTEDFARWMLTDFQLDQTTVMVSPAQGFYATPGRGVNEARIAYVLEQARLRDAVAVLTEGLRAYRRVRNPEAVPLGQEPEAEEPDFSLPVES